MRPLYFGDARRPLFGVYHPPQGTRARDGGVLLCYPAPQEYMGSHWALRKLSLALAREGFHVFRFDYFGTGDSAGQTGEGTLEQWRTDIATALDELKDVSGVRRASVVGFRLGAALAAQAPIQAKDLVLWEPVVHGGAYLDELRESHQRLFSDCIYPPPVGPRGRMGELLGLPFPAAQERATEAIDLMQPFSCRAERISIVASERRPQYVELHEHLMAHRPPGAAAVELHVEEEAGPSSDEPFLLSSRAQQAIAARLAGKAAWKAA